MYRFPLPLLVAVLLVASAGCDSAGPDAVLPHAALERAPATASNVSASTTISLNGHTVTFLGASPVNGGSRTRFVYEVTSINPGPPALDWFFLENACASAPTATEPSNAVRSAVEGGIPGIKWNGSLPPGETRTYSYTFDGALEVRLARATISRGGVTGTATLPGPCGGFYVRGDVFVNADGLAGRSATEAGVADVRVEAATGSGVVGSAVTDADGRYQMLVPSGTYSLRVPLAAAGMFNESLYGSYNSDDAPDGSSPATRPLVVSADVSGQNFGFAPDKDAIVQNLSPGGAFQTRAQSVRFWQGAIRSAARGRDTANPYAGGQPLTPNVVRGLLDAIFYVSGEPESAYYLLQVPYVLTGTDPFAAALDELSKPARTELEKVSRNLFAMELNRLQGWGTPDPQYDDVLMAYLEEWVRGGGAPAGFGKASAPTSTAAPGGGGGGTVESITSAYLVGGGGGGTVED